MFALDYIGAGRSSSYTTNYTLMDVTYVSHTWSGMIALYSAAISIAGFLFVVFGLLTLYHDQAPENFTPAVANALNVCGLVVLDMILAFNAGLMVGVDEVFQIAAYMALSTLCILFMRASHTSEPVTLLAAFFCRAAAIIVLSLNVSLTDMVIDQRMRSAFIIYAVVVLALDFLHVLSRISRPLMSESAAERTERRAGHHSRITGCCGRCAGGAFEFFIRTFSSGTYSPLKPVDKSNADAEQEAATIALASGVHAAVHAVVAVVFVVLTSIDFFPTYARLDFNVKGMFVWSRAYPLMKWVMPVLWGVPTLLYGAQALWGGLRYRWAATKLDTLSMPGTSLSIAVQDFCIVSLLGPLYMVTAWQEYVFVGCLLAISALYILNIASLDWYYHLIAALAPLTPFLFVVIRQVHIVYDTTDIGLIALMFSLYALRSILLLARTKLFGYNVSRTTTRTWCTGSSDGYRAMVIGWLPVVQFTIALTASIIVVTHSYYGKRSAVIAALPTGIVIA